MFCTLGGAQEMGNFPKWGKEQSEGRGRIPKLERKACVGADSDE